MKQTKINDLIRFFRYFIILIFLLSSCRATKYVPQNEYLLDKYAIKGHDSNIDKEELKNYIRQKPNKKILGLKFHLGLYNLSNIDKENWWNRFLRTIGEEPVIFDEFLTEKTKGQLELFLRNKGYYNAVVIDSIELKNRKATVTYQITPYNPYHIRNIKYEFEDTLLRKVVLKDTLNSLLSKGKLFDLDVLSAERERIENYLKNMGYYYFTGEYIYYQADTTVADYAVDLELVIKKFRIQKENGNYFDVPHPVIRIGKVFMHTDYSQREVLNNPEKYTNSLDTLEIDSVNLVYKDYLKIKSGVIIESGYIIPGALYNLDNVRRTYRNLSSLRLFRLVNIEFKSTGEINANNEHIMDCEIFLTPHTLQSYTVELQGTNSSGNIGAAGNLIYQHRNLLGGAENLDFRITGAFETLKESYRQNFGNMIEFGGDMRLMIPKFFLPFKTDQFIRKYNPATAIELAYNYQSLLKWI